MKKQVDTQNRQYAVFDNTWNYLSPETAIKRWSREVEVLVRSGSPEDWDSSGHGVLIEIGETDEAGLLVQSAAITAKANYINIYADDVVESINSLKQLTKESTPTVCYLHPGLWQDGKEIIKKYATQKEISPEQVIRFREYLIRFLTKEILGKPLIIVTSAENFLDLHKSLRAAGVFDRKIEVNDLSVEDKAACFIKAIGKERLAESVTSNHTRLGHLINYEYKDCRRRQLCEVALRRLAWQEKRKIEFSDIVNLVAYGTSDFDDVSLKKEMDRRTAVHEAGHAVLSHIDSRKKVPPSYCGIIKRNGTLGLMVPAFEGHEMSFNDLSFQDNLHRIRVLLAGRVAEDWILGNQETSAAGASLDLQKATDLAVSLIKNCGYGGKNQHKNLAVFEDEISQVEAYRVEREARKLLATQYKQTLKILKKNKKYFELIVGALCKKKVLFTQDFEDLLRKIRKMKPACI